VSGARLNHHKRRARAPVVVELTVTSAQLTAEIEVIEAARSVVGVHSRTRHYDISLSMALERLRKAVVAMDGEAWQGWQRPEHPHGNPGVPETNPNGG
jgi:hypothetical protein